MAFPISEATPVRFAPALPKSADVVVIGGGIIGVMTAWHLAERGARVVLCEKGRIAGEQSSRNWGWIRQQGRDFGELPIMMESLRIWRAIVPELGEDIGFRRTGVMYLAGSEAELAGFEAWRLEAQGYGVDSKMLGAGAVAGQISGASRRWPGALFTPSDARAEPWLAVPRMAEGAVRRGAVLIESCAVRALDTAAGRIAGVITEQGRIACDQVVLAGGAWSRLLAQAHGVHFPQLSVRATVMATEAMPEVFAGAAADPEIAFRRRADGGYTLAAGSGHDFYIGPDAFRSFIPYLPVLKRDFRSTQFQPMAPRHYPDGWMTPRKWQADRPSPFEAIRVLNPAPSDKLLARMQAAFEKTFPGIGPVIPRATWAGMIDTMPDIVPVIDRAAALPGLVIATGMCGHGFGIGPGIGRVVADLTLGRDPGHDLSRFRLSRFTDGSTLTPGPSL
ncbi:NAD(P)/FAD-dependent oxidoreductase [Gemmobacter serpentinus]|uniref:NAD(P)/FAD-dependent oxidoreductase n=1 Tax=Gemmobacter serpentinus TaxID=2652247 RepID=UPI0018657CD9|nr:FAD-binding oxidoreductase [Gemmobacter serpentinus]